MPSQSSCTYEEYSRDLLDSPDLNQWKGCMVEPGISNELFGFEDGVVSISYSSAENDKPITTVDMMRIDEYTFELLVPVPPVCVRTATYLTNSKHNDIIMCLSNFAERNIVFAMQGCVLCANDTKVSLYVPSTLKKAAYKDMRISGIECSDFGIFNGYSHHKVVVPTSLVPKARELFNRSHKMKLTKDHKPMVTNGYEYFCKATPILYVKAKSQKEVSTSLSNEPVEEISERKILVKPLGFMECLPRQSTAQQ